MLEIRNVTKRYRGDVLANDDISLEVGAGEVFGLLGPNGAGKTTLVAQILGLAARRPATILIDGVDVVQRPAFARAVVLVPAAERAFRSTDSHRSRRSSSPDGSAAATSGRVRRTRTAAHRRARPRRVAGQVRPAVRRCLSARRVLHGGGRAGACGHPRRADQRHRSAAPQVPVDAGPRARRCRFVPCCS